MKFKIKKHIALIMVFTLVFTILFNGFNTYAEAFEDSTGHWAEPYINTIKPLGVISGYPDGTFKPESFVTRIQFIAIAVNSLEIQTRQVNPNEYWGTPYVEAALNTKLISESEYGGLTENSLNKNITREEMASIIVNAFYSTGAKVSATELQSASSKLSDLNQVSQEYQEQAIAAVALKIIEGYSDNTFRPLNNASRAQAAAVSYKLLVEIGSITPITNDPTYTFTTAFAVNGIEIGDPYDLVLQKFGSPIREDLSEYGFKWMTYHNQYRNYFQVGVQNGEVVALFTASNLLTSTNGYKMNLTKTQVNTILGSPLSSIVKGNSEFLQYNDSETATYLNNNAYITSYYDTSNSGKLFATRIISKTVEQAFRSQYGTPSEALRIAFEKQLFDLANVYRLDYGKATLKWHEGLSAVARKHSQDMAVRDFFSHINPSNYTPFDRIVADGIDYSVAAENIAAGYTNAYATHTGWVNSPGHRENLLRTVEYVGVGVYFGGNYMQYFTQDFITP